MTYTVAQTETNAVRDDILALWARNLPEASPQRYDWLYENGPTQGWVVRDDDETIIGSIGMMDRTMKVFNDICRTGQPVDFNVDKQHRTVGPALQLQRRLTEAVDDGQLALSYGLPNEQAQPVLRRVGYRATGIMGRWTKPLRTYDVLGDYLKNRSFRKAASVVLDAGLQLTSPETRRCRRRGIRAEIVDRFDDRFDRLWAAARDKYAIIGQRTSDYLQWRFAECPDVRYRTLTLCDDCDRLLAYLTYSQDKGRAYIGDLLFVNDADLELLLCEFIWLLRRQRKEAATMIFHGNSFIKNILRKFGFRYRPSQWQVLVYANRDELAAAANSDDLDASYESAMNEENWFLTQADIDT